MFIGKWNRSVILTYIGLVFSIMGIYLAIVLEKTNYAFICLMVAGICDMFDGFVARKCKRTEEEKAFGIELDSLVDVVSFVIFPIALFVSLGLKEWYHFILYAAFAICGVARLAYFNIIVEDSSKPVKYYQGLPVTSVALILPILHAFSYFLNNTVMKCLYIISMIIITIFFIANVKIKKAKGMAYIFFSILFVVMVIFYIFFL